MQTVGLLLAMPSAVSELIHCCTLSLCYLGAETDDLHINPNINTEIHLVGQLTMSELALGSYTRSMCATLRLLLGSSLQKQKHISIYTYIEVSSAYNVVS